ncbi:6869_t:CDS:2 [Paraglomus brasilianum]|uniref:6869_t:CDS:1 n=1 Tax=Paraglomus brasilianum TaxID=144538 RepID=A0A9N8VYC7_9GLOM|nr:6869_t:CDS:2 [Paraglomus brasilianum]
MLKNFERGQRGQQLTALEDKLFAEVELTEKEKEILEKLETVKNGMEWSGGKISERRVDYSGVGGVEQCVHRPKRTPFPWVTNINESSIDKLKKKITVTWADIENVNEATLAIFVGMKKAIITDDLDLQRTLKAFTDFKFQEVYRLFGISEGEDPSLSIPGV